MCLGILTLQHILLRVVCLGIPSALQLGQLHGGRLYVRHDSERLRLDHRAHRHPDAGETLLVWLPVLAGHGLQLGDVRQLGRQRLRGRHRTFLGTAAQGVWSTARLDFSAPPGGVAKLHFGAFGGSISGSRRARWTCAACRSGPAPSTDLLSDSLALTGLATLDGLTAQGNVGCDELLCNDTNCTSAGVSGASSYAKPESDRQLWGDAAEQHKGAMNKLLHRGTSGRARNKPAEARNKRGQARNKRAQARNKKTQTRNKKMPTRSKRGTSCEAALRPGGALQTACLPRRNACGAAAGPVRGEAVRGP